MPRPGISRRRLAQMLNPRPGEQLLEVGPGYGHYTLPVARALGREGTLAILDLHQTLLDQTMQRAAAEGLTNVRATRGDGRALPYPDRHFDAAYLVACLGEIPDRAAAIHELARVLRPGGRLVVGESAVDPHRVRLPALTEHARRAGLRAGATVGRVSYFARFDKPHDAT
jgi:ubiquinone/menaquinone biosynthesis C-methylase UbiE